MGQWHYEQDTDGGADATVVGVVIGVPVLLAVAYAYEVVTGRFPLAREVVGTLFGYGLMVTVLFLLVGVPILAGLWALSGGPVDRLLTRWNLRRRHRARE